MKRILGMIAIICVLFLVTACSDEGDRSFSIDDVTIDAQIDEEGMIHVSELYTYTFDGSFEGMTRSIGSEVHGFKAYLPGEEETNPTIETDGLDPLTIEKDESMWKIHSASKNETKQVLYRYTIKGSVEKYQDIGDLTYAFFDESNETDLHDVKITIHTPENKVTNDTHFFLHKDEEGILTAMDHDVVYTNDKLESGTRSEVRIIFPATELKQMKMTKDKNMKEKFLTAEQNLLKRSEYLQENTDKMIPLIWLLIVGVMIAVSVVLMKHPNRYRGNQTMEEFSGQLEDIDPLFVSYLSQNGYLSAKSVIAALFSLKQRGMITLEEVPSIRKPEEMTFRFTWTNDGENVDVADSYLREWLFTEKDNKGAYFLLEEIIDDENESESVRKEKGETFGDNFDIWSGLVTSRESYQRLKRRFYGFSRLSALLTILTFSGFYYLTTVDVISQTEQIVLSLIFAVISIVCLIFSRYKWLLLLYYPGLIITSLIAFTLTKGTILLVTFFTISFLSLLIIPAKYWIKDILQLIHVINHSRKLMKKGDYPVRTDPYQLEMGLEYAMILDVGKPYAKEIKDTDVNTLNTIDFPLLSNPDIATESFNSGNLMLLSAAFIGSTGSTSTTTSSTGGGGAGAF